jgi:hypothetical protein
MPARRIRKTTIKEWLLYFPFHASIILNEFWADIDWRDIEYWVGLPFGIICNTLVYHAVTQKREESDIIYVEEPIGGQFIWTLVASTLIGISFVNMGICLLSKKSYRLFYRDMNDIPDVSSAVQAAMELPDELDGDPSSTVDKLDTHRQGLLGSIFPFLSPPLSSNNPVQVWEVKVWNPPPLSFPLLLFFSPIHALALFYYPTFTTIALCILLSVQTSLLAIMFKSLQRDEKFLQKEFLKEMDSASAAPLGRDATTQTMEDHSHLSHVLTSPLHRMGYRKSHSIQDLRPGRRKSSTPSKLKDKNA